MSKLHSRIQCFGEDGYSTDNRFSRVFDPLVGLFRKKDATNRPIGVSRNEGRVRAAGPSDTSWCCLPACHADFHELVSGGPTSG